MYNRFLQSHPNHAQSHFDLAYELKSVKDCNKAVVHFKNTLELNPVTGRRICILPSATKYWGMMNWPLATWQLISQETKPNMQRHEELGIW